MCIMVRPKNAHKLGEIAHPPPPPKKVPHKFFILMTTHTLKASWSELIRTPKVDDKEINNIINKNFFLELNSYLR